MRTKKYIPILATAAVFCAAVPVYANITAQSLVLYSLYSTYLNPSEREALYDGLSCSGIVNQFQDPQKRIETLSYYILLNTLPNTTKTAIDDDKSAAAVVSTHHLIRSNLSLDYYRITHPTETFEQPETTVYAGYVQWLQGIYGTGAMSFEGEAISRFLQTNPPKDESIEQYLTEIVQKDTNFNGKDLQTKTIAACNIQEFNRKSAMERNWITAGQLIQKPAYQHILELFLAILVWFPAWKYGKKQYLIWDKKRKERKRFEALKYGSIFIWERNKIPQRAREAVLNKNLTEIEKTNNK